MKNCIAALLAVFLAGVLGAQGSVNLTGSVGDTEDDFFLVAVDFGGVAQAIDITLTIGATGGTAGLSADLVDLTELCANGSATGVESDFDPGTGTMVLMMSPTYTGVMEFAVALQTDGIGPASPYSGTFAVSAGSVSILASAKYPITPGLVQTMVGRAVRFGFEPGGATTNARDFIIDAGPTPRTVTFFALSFIFAPSATFQIYEISEAGAEQLLATLTDDDEANPTTSTRSGQVRIRVRITAPSGGAYIWQCVMPTGVPVQNASSGGGGGGKKDDGCAASAGAAALPLAPLLLLAARRRRYA